jgi:hypothetical protein
VSVSNIWVASIEDITFFPDAAEATGLGSMGTAGLVMGRGAAARGDGIE